MEQQLFSSVCLDLARRKKAFLNAMEEEFAPFIKSGKEKNSFEWTHLKSFYNKRKNELTNLYSLRIFCEFAFKLFFTFNCQDDEFVIKIILIYQRVIGQYSKFDFCAYCKQFNDFPKHYHDEDVINSRSILKSVNKLGIVVGYYKFTNRDFYARLAVGAIYVGDYAFLQFLVKYGLSYIPDDISHQARIQFGTLFSNYVSLKPQAGNDVLTERDNFATSVLKKLHKDVKNPNLRRINLIVLAVDISLCKRVGDFYYEDYAKCLNLYALTLSEAAISMKDVKDILDLAFSDDKSFIDETFSRFKEVFPDTPDLPSPRSLKYLCRCKVRDYIQKCPSLTLVLSKMHIPTPIKDYLLYMSD